MNITDADREAAMAFHKASLHHVLNARHNDAALLLLEAFAAHRMTTRRKTLGEAADMIDIGNPIASIIAIRAMIEGETE